MPFQLLLCGSSRFSVHNQFSVSLDKIYLSSRDQGESPYIIFFNYKNTYYDFKLNYSLIRWQTRKRCINRRQRDISNAFKIFCLNPENKFEINMHVYSISSRLQYHTTYTSIYLLSKHRGLNASVTMFYYWKGQLTLRWPRVVPSLDAVRLVQQQRKIPPFQ